MTTGLHHQAPNGNASTGSTPDRAGVALDRGVTASPLEIAVAHALELRDAGRADWLEAACGDNPHLLADVRAAVHGASKLQGLFVDVAGQDQHLGRTLRGRFELQRRLGSGAMGVVYLAHDRELNRAVAVKVLRPGLMDAADSAKRFMREAEAMASVRHSAVITVHDRGVTESGEPFIVMEFVEGEPLSGIVDEAQRAKAARSFERAGWVQATFRIDDRGDGNYLRNVVRWVAELAAGLEAVHASGVLHRDIKPSNVIVRRNGLPVLLDFGIALLDGDSTLTRGVTSVGTPSYMPPEALERGRPRTPASDVYSLTATLYHLLALRPPYEGTPTEVLAAIATRDPVPASKHAGGLPRDLQAILDKGMHRRPAARYRSAAAFEADLRAFLEYRPVSARPVGPVARTFRRLVRTKAALGASTALALVAALGTASEIRGALDERRLNEHAAVLRHFPPTFTLVEPQNREYRYDVDRRALEALLDRAVATSAHPLPTRLLRSSLRLDHGDPRGAASDMAAIADRLGTPLARALAAAYAAIPVDGKGAEALTLGALPPPSSAYDRYLLAYHMARRNVPGARKADAVALLADAEVRALIPHAEELYLASDDFEDMDGEEIRRRSLELFTETLRLEGRLGGPTAVTAHIRGRLLTQLGRFDEALKALRASVALADRAHTIRINACQAALGAGEYEEALDHIEVAIDLRPNDPKPLMGLAWTLIGLRRFDEATRRIAEAPLDDSEFAREVRGDMAFEVVVQEALHERESGNTERSADAVRRAEEMLATLDEAARVRVAPSVVLLDALRTGDEAAAFRGLAALLAEDPIRVWLLYDTLAHMPAQLDADETASVRKILRQLAARIATPPGDHRQR